MKKIATMITSALLLAVSVNAQTVYDAVKLAEKELNGTARFVGMGGAMGALGGDISTIGTNPAGIGIYRSNDVMTSFSASMYGLESQYGTNSFKSDKTRWSYDNIGFVLSSKIGNQTPLRFVNFGFNYHRTKSFYKNMSMAGAISELDGNVISQTFQMSDQANAMRNDGTNISGVKGNRFSNGAVGWLAIVGWNGFLYNQEGETGPYSGFLPAPDAFFSSRERGGIDQYDFNVSFNLNDRVYFGVTVGAYNVDYAKTSTYVEEYGDVIVEGTNYGEEGYDMTTDKRIEGAGFDLKFGAIFRPFENSPLRIGLALHTPTFYNLTYKTNVYAVTDILGENDKGNLEVLREVVDSYYDLNDKDMAFDFHLRTPWVYNVSLGYTVGSSLALGAEYEYEDYSSMKFNYPEGDEMTFENSEAGLCLNGTHTFRIGAEYKVIPQFAFRLGYNYSSSIFKNDAIKALPYNSVVTDTDFANTKSRNNYTLGIGYRGSLFYADLAYQYSTYKEDFYPFYNQIDNFNATPEATKVTNTRSQVLVTLGMRF